MSDRFHKPDPYSNHVYGLSDSYVSYVHSNAFLLRGARGGSAEPPVLSGNLAGAAQALREQQEAAEAAARSPGPSLLDVFLGTLLLLALLQSFLLLAQRAYVWAASRPQRTKGNPSSSTAWVVTHLHFLAPSAPSSSSSSNSSSSSASARGPMLFGVLMGCVGMLLVQWIMAPATMAAMFGQSGAGRAENDAAAAAAGAVTSTPHMQLSAAAALGGGAAGVVGQQLSCPPAPACPVVRCPPQPKCPACARWPPVFQLSRGEKCPPCTSISDPPPVDASAAGASSSLSSSSVLSPQSVYEPLKYSKIPCPEWENDGRWVARPRMDPSNPSTWPEWARSDRAVEGSSSSASASASSTDPAQFQMVWDPPPACAVGRRVPEAWRRFHPLDFLQSLRGRTLAFLGDEVMGQLVDMLQLRLGQYVRAVQVMQVHPANEKGDTSGEETLVREVHLAYNVTLKSQVVPRGAQPVLYPYATILRSDFLLLNLAGGAAVSDKDEFAAQFQEVAAWLKANYEGTIMWREHAPAHYATPTGEMDEKQRREGHRAQCKDVDPSSNLDARFTQHRLILGNSLAREAGFPVLPVFNSTLALPAAAAHHPGQGECRLWKSHSSVLEHWTDILFNALVPSEPVQE